MPAGALRLLLLLELSYVTAAMMPRDGEAQRRLDAPQTSLRNSPPAPVASDRRAPPFMMDMFNLVSGSGTRRSQKEILEGNMVRSLEAKGEQKGET